MVQPYERSRACGCDLRNRCRCRPSIDRCANPLLLVNTQLLGGDAPTQRPSPQQFRIRSEPHLRAHRHRVELRAGVDEIERTCLLDDDAVQVIQHEPNVFGGIPVEPGGVDGLLAAGRAVRKPEPIVEVDLAVAAGDFPRAPVAALPGPRMGRYDVVIAAGRGIVGAGFAGQGPACFDRR